MWLPNFLRVLRGKGSQLGGRGGEHGGRGKGVIWGVNQKVWINENYKQS